MYKIIFYKAPNGKSEVKELLDSLYKSKSKDSKINFKKVQDYINALQLNGLSLNETYIKHLDGEIWELRPIRNRILLIESTSYY